MAEAHLVPPHNPPPPGQALEDAPLDLRQYWNTIVNHLWTVVLVTVAVTAGTTLWTLRQPKIYRAQAQVAVDFNTPKVLSEVREVVELGSLTAWNNRAYMDLQLAMLRSREVSLEIARRLAEDPTFVPVSERESALRWLPNYVRGVLQASSDKDSRIVNIVAEDTAPERITRVVNVAADVFIERNLEQKMEATVGANEWLVGQVDELEGSLEKSEVALQRFKEEHDILSATFEDRQSINSQDLLALSKAITDLRLRKMELEVREQQTQRVMAESADGGLGVRALPQVYSNASVQEHHAELQKLRTERADLLSRYGELHPKLQSIERQIQMQQEELDREIQLILEVERRSLSELNEVEKVYETALERAKSEAFEVNRHEIAYNRLRREQTNNERLYEMVLRRQKEADLSAAMKFNNMRLMEKALVPNTPVRPNNTRNVMFGMIIGLLLGIAMAFLLEFLDNTVKSQADVEQKLGMVFLGVLPSIKSTTGEATPEAKEGTARSPSRDLHVHLYPKSAVAECCRALRTNLLFMTPDAPLKTILITSPGPQEGKTTAAISLSIAMAQSGGRTLLVDTDLRRPRIHKSFQISNQVGVTSVLVGDCELKDAIKSTEVPGLYVLPCGPIPPNPAELLHTARFQETLEKLKEQFDRVILDSPPVGAVADALILSSYVGGVVMALRCNKTSKDMAARTRRALVDVNAHMLGVVLNDLDLESKSGYYSYYLARYGYVYGDPEGEGTSSAKAA
ncbi:MAG: polysaccharide biosynthesis tyrosine autokinase [Myxococcota bacterium]